MDEQNNKPEQDKPEKKLSRTTLTFYIVGLFSVAIALILISYVAQARADRQGDTLTDQLTEQQTVAQGATQKVEEIQKQLDEMTGELSTIRSKLGIQAEDSVTEAVQELREREQVLELLVSAQEAAREGDMDQLAYLMDGFTDAWPEDKLKLRTEGGLFEESDYAVYQELQAMLEQTNE